MAIDAFLNTKITGVANTYGIPPEIMRSVVVQESGGNQFDPKTGLPLTSNKGAIGLTQLMPSTARDLGVDPYDADQNLIGGAKYLAQLKNQFGDWETALTAYNGGMGNVQRGTVSDDAKAYSRQVLERAGMGGATETMGYDANGMPTGPVDPVTQTGTPENTKAFNEAKSSSFFGLNLPNVGLFVLGAVVLGIGLAVSVFGAKETVIQTALKMGGK